MRDDYLVMWQHCTPSLLAIGEDGGHCRSSHQLPTIPLSPPPLVRQSLGCGNWPLCSNHGSLECYYQAQRDDPMALSEGRPIANLP